MLFSIETIVYQEWMLLAAVPRSLGLLRQEKSMPNSSKFFRVEGFLMQCCTVQPVRSVHHSDWNNYEPLESGGSTASGWYRASKKNRVFS